MSSRLPLFFVLLISYLFLFSLQETKFAENNRQLAQPLPSPIQKIALGYLRQLGGEMQFIKASVFFGGVKPGRDPLEYAEPLAQHFSAAAHLHPHFVDTYFLCQATLPYLNNEYAHRTNAVLGLGINALPDNFVLPFFAGFNRFYYLNEPLEAAKLLNLAAQRPNSPVILEHLANILAAEGGDIYAALLGLRGMFATEKDERIKQRYREEISAFEKALQVLKSIRRYEEETGSSPVHLAQLVPSHIPSLPDVGPHFTLQWNPPRLQVVRIDAKKQKREKL